MADESYVDSYGSENFGENFGTAKVMVAEEGYSDTGGMLRHRRDTVPVGTMAIETSAAVRATAVRKLRRRELLPGL